MKLFLRDHVSFLILYFFNLFFLFIIYDRVGGFENNIFYFLFLSTFLLVCYLSYRYFSNRTLYRRLSQPLSSLEDYLSSTGNTPLAEGFNELQKRQYDLYQAQLQQYIRKQNEHLTFINQWVHQMKTPLSVMQLIIQENEGEPGMNNIRQEVERLDSGLNMALYMARLDSFQYDFCVKTIVLNSLALEMVNEFKRLFIRKHVYPEVHIEPAITVPSDEKWLKFILGQLLTNAIRYSAQNNKKIMVSAYQHENNVVMEVKDEGIGIPETDIRRVFEPFYTGENGRRFGESTGMGLYLVKEVCKRLSHQIELDSEVGKGTTVRIIFPI